MPLWSYTVIIWEDKLQLGVAQKRAKCLDPSFVSEGKDGQRRVGENTRRNPSRFLCPEECNVEDMSKGRVLSISLQNIFYFLDGLDDD